MKIWKCQDQWICVTGMKGFALTRTRGVVRYRNQGVMRYRNQGVVRYRNQGVMCERFSSFGIIIFFVNHFNVK